MSQPSDSLAVVAEGLRKNLLITVKISTVVFAAAVSFLLLFSIGAPLQLPAYQIDSIYVFLVLVAAFSLVFPFGTVRINRKIGTFFHRLQPRVGAYAYMRLVGPEAILDNGLVISHFVEGGGGRSPNVHGFNLEVYLDADGSVLMPTPTELRIWDGHRFPLGGGSLMGKKGPPALRAEAETLRTRLGFSLLWTTIGARAPQQVPNSREPHWRAHIRAEDPNWYRKATLLLETADEIVGFLSSLMSADFSERSG